jgi:hypothetical protein
MLLYHPQCSELERFDCSMLAEAFPAADQFRRVDDIQRRECPEVTPPLISQNPIQ